MIKVWGRDNSVNVKKVLWCLDELELAFEHIRAGGAHGIVDSPEYLAMNPTGLVPSIDDKGFTLWESNTIVRYLCTQYGRAPLHATGVRELAVASQWMDWASWSVGGPYRELMFNLIRAPEDQRDRQAAARAAQAWEHSMAMADQVLSTRPYLAGDSFSMADIPLGCLVYGWLNFPVERTERPHVRAWYERLCSRPAYRKRVMLPLT